MRNWALARRMMREAEKRTSPWKQVLYDYAFISLGKAVSTIIILTGGALISSETNDWMWLSRAGCVIVVVGVIAAVADIEQALAGKSRGRLSGEDTGAVAEDERSIKELVRQIDYGMLIIGNLIWGFGDLVGKLVHR